MEKKIYLIKAYEGFYGGLHGVVDYVIEKTFYDDVIDIARGMSYDLMDSYGQIYESFAEDAAARGLEDYEYDQYIDERFEENVMYEIYEVINRDNEDINNLNEEMMKDPETFIENYCKIH